MLEGAKPMSQKPKSQRPIGPKSLIALPFELEQMNRRQLLENGAALTAYVSLSSLLNPQIVQAAPTFPPARKLIWINMSGGWDILETTDPKPSSSGGVDMIYDWGQAQTLVGGDGTKIGRWMPNIAAMGQDVLVVRGMAMGTTSHEAGSVYMDTGILSNAGRVNAASIPSIIASESIATIPLIQLNGGSDPMIDRGLLNQVSVVRAGNLDLYRSMYPTEAALIERKRQMLIYLRESIARVRAQTGNNDRVEDLEAAESKLTAQFAGDVGSKLSLSVEDSQDFSRCTSNGRANGTSDAFALATKLVVNDLVTTVNLGIGGFDTHANQTMRMQPIVEMADKLVRTMCDKLRLAGKLNSTLIVLYSDFGRTPKINGSNGRDHWPVGGAMMIGGGIAGGRAVGSTNANLLAENINLSSGAIQANGEQINPTHLAGSVIALTLGSGYLAYRPYFSALELLTRLRA
jgi:hypothetical protein